MRIDIIDTAQNQTLIAIASVSAFMAVVNTVWKELSTQPEIGGTGAVPTGGRSKNNLNHSRGQFVNGER